MPQFVWHFTPSIKTSVTAKIFMSMERKKTVMICFQFPVVGVNFFGPLNISVNSYLRKPHNLTSYSINTHHSVVSSTTVYCMPGIELNTCSRFQFFFFFFLVGTVLKLHIFLKVWEAIKYM